MKPWTYLSLKAVFQYMDVNKRLELNSHCPALRSAESSVPLNLQSLTLEKEKIVANDVCYKVESKSQRIKSILDGRKEVRVEILKIRNSSVIPGSLKISPINLDSGNLNLEKVLPFINRSSFPLRELRVNISKTPNLEKYLGCTQALILFETNLDQEKSDWIRNVLYNRKSPNIELENISLSSDDTIALIQNWRNNQKEVGTVLKIHHEYGDLPLSDVDELMDVLNGRFAYFNDSVLQNSMDRCCTSFPFNETSEVVLYSIIDEQNWKETTKLEVMPIGSTREETHFEIFIELFPFFIAFLLLITFLLLLFRSLIRLEINSHYPALRSAESSIPLNLQSLTLESRNIVANHVCYKVESKYQRIKSILDGRKEVRVDILKIRNSRVIPDSLKIRTRNLDSGNLNLERVVPFINRSSFPLRELRVNIAKTPNLKKYLGCTQKLILFETNHDGENGDLVRSILYDRNSSNIVLENISLSRDTQVTLIQNWINNQKEIGTVLTMQNRLRILPISFLYRDEFPNANELVEVLNGRISNFNDSVLQ
ncbi:hypothetical protein CRE_09602 [Caenorhabditis remanei]|uniref:Uncharacterized protein n=1 Tax=Caenorhabditis remanei TaxID=31234 RepID=E3MJ89_CAERE|nr:hypothetical protein CRE_09602 [Caenorhabditis remanei]